LSRFACVISVEAQTISGGLASLLGQIISCGGLNCRLSPLAVRTSPDGRSGTELDCWRRSGLDRTAIVERALSILGRSSLVAGASQ